MARLSQSRPHSGLGFQVQVLETFKSVPLHSEAVSKKRVPGADQPPAAVCLAEVLMGLATDTTIYLSRREEALEVNKLIFTIRASDSSWHPGIPGRPLSLSCPLEPRL